MVIEQSVFKFYCDPPCPSELNKKSNLDRHKDGTGCYHKRPHVFQDCNKRFRDKDLGGHKQGGRCVKKGKMSSVIAFHCKRNDFIEGHGFTERRQQICDCCLTIEVSEI